MTAPCRCCADDPVTAGPEVFRAFIPLELNSAMNGRVTNDGSSRWAYSKHREAWYRAVVLTIGNATKATGERRVFLTRIYGGRQRGVDPDNLATSMKALQDALVNSGLLLDDSPGKARIHYRQRRDAALRGVEIVIEDIQPTGES